MQSCNSSAISIQLGSASCCLAAEVWELRSAALAQDRSLLGKYFHYNEVEDESVNNIPKPKTLFIDDSGEFFPREQGDLDTENLLWTGNARLIQQDNR